MIPKIIHYCWFGRNDKSELARKCIASWGKFFPDYEIKEWNEDNFDIQCCAYVKEAYQMRKWAFVSDYARFWILYREGGLYFDTDVEVIKSMDCIITRGAFMGCEPGSMIVCNHKGTGTTANVAVKCAPGLGLGMNPGLGLIKEILEFYQGIHFIKEDGSIDTSTVVEYTTDILKKHGFVGNGNIEYVQGIYIYPPEYFCPLDYHKQELNITDNTYSIHHYGASWKEKEEIMMAELSRKLQETLPYPVAWLLCTSCNSLVRLRVGIRRYGLKKSLTIIAFKIFGRRKDKRGKSYE